MASPIDEMLNRLDWQPIPGTDAPPKGQLIATHVGLLRLGPAELRVYQLSDGNRVIDADDLQRFLGENLG